MAIESGRGARFTLLCWMILLGWTAPAAAQVRPAARAFWIAGAAGVVTAAALDGSARSYALGHRGTALDRTAEAVAPLGLAHYCVPGLALAYVGSRIVGDSALAAAALRVAAGYVFADAIESVLKPAVGRERPLVNGDPDRFHPFTGNGDDHSFPSAHVVHAMSIAAGIAAEAKNPAVSAVAYGTAALVGAERVYADAHWLSDVAFSAVLAIAASHTAIALVDGYQGRGRHEAHPGARNVPRAGLTLDGEGVGVVVRF